MDYEVGMSTTGNHIFDIRFFVRNTRIRLILFLITQFILKDGKNCDSVL